MNFASVKKCSVIKFWYYFRCNFLSAWHPVISIYLLNFIIILPVTQAWLHTTNSIVLIEMLPHSIQLSKEACFPLYLQCANGGSQWPHTLLHPSERVRERDSGISVVDTHQSCVRRALLLARQAMQTCNECLLVAACVHCCQMRGHRNCLVCTF